MIRASAVIGHVAAAADIGSRRTCTRLAIAEIKGSGSVRVRDWPGCGRGVTWSSSTRHEPDAALSARPPVPTGFPYPALSGTQAPIRNCPANGLSGTQAFWQVQ
jgi:hypothetical protein